MENIFCSVSFLEHYAENMKYKMKFLEQYSYSLFIFDFVKDLKRVDHVMSGFLLSISQK